MIFASKAFVCLAWIFWIMIIDNSAIGKDNTSMPMMDHSKMTLSEVEKVKKMVVVRDSYIKKPEYNPSRAFGQSRHHRRQC